MRRQRKNASTEMTTYISKKQDIHTSVIYPVLTKHPSFCHTPGCVIETVSLFMIDFLQFV